MPRKASSLDATIGPSKTADHRLKLYSAAALGAGVSMLAMSQHTLVPHWECLPWGRMD
jgi:hypothetical protein